MSAERVHGSRAGGRGRTKRLSPDRGGETENAEADVCWTHPCGPTRKGFSVGGTPFLPPRRFLMKLNELDPSDGVTALIRHIGGALYAFRKLSCRSVTVLEAVGGLRFALLIAQRWWRCRPRPALLDHGGSFPQPCTAGHDPVSPYRDLLMFPMKGWPSSDREPSGQEAPSAN